MPKSLQQHCESLGRSISDQFESYSTGVTAREDSRAFGAMVEKNITSNWEAICKELKVAPLEIPGRRTIFDCAYLDGKTTFGLDVKTKDLDSTVYSDGGICAVGNLLKFLVNDKGVFLIVEVGHSSSSTKKSSRDINYILVAPFSCLPADSYRIENLGTGQVRLNHTINEVYEKIDWNRSNESFYEIFIKLAVTHYERVTKDAQKRIDSINEFKKNGFERFSFGR
jgi:hypothetical protein